MTAITWVRNKAAVTTEIVVITAEEAAATEGSLVGTFERREFRWAGRMPRRMIKEITIAGLEKTEEAYESLINPYRNRNVDGFMEYSRVEFHRVGA